MLLLEVPDDELPNLLAQIDAGQAEVPLLGEDIAAIVRAARHLASAAGMPPFEGMIQKPVFRPPVRHFLPHLRIHSG